MILVMQSIWAYGLLGIVTYVLIAGDQVSCGQLTEPSGHVIFIVLLFCPFVLAARRVDGL